MLLLLFGISDVIIIVIDRVLNKFISVTTVISVRLLGCCWRLVLVLSLFSVVGSCCGNLSPLQLLWVEVLLWLL